jgi:hypothetical protein
MSQYDRQVAQAVKLIAKYGQLVTWRKQTVEQADVNAPWKTTAKAGQPVDYSVKIVFPRDGKGLANALYHLIKGTDVPTGAPRGLMASVAFTPELTDLVIRDGVKMMIKTIDPLAPGGIILLYHITFA